MYGNSAEKGSAIFFSVIALAIILGVAVGFNTILFGGLQILKGTGNSAIAFYAAESGAENILFEDITCLGNPGCLQAAAAGWGGGSGVVTFSNNASYKVMVEGEGIGDCPASPAVAAYCAKSTGTFQKANRTIEVAR